MSQIDQFQHLKIQLEAIQSATNNFSDDNCIGRGGFGRVYKGELVHSKGEAIVALKRLDRASMQGGPEFWKEVMTLPLYAHDNIISLLGYCDDQHEKILVYEYLSKRSLDSYLASDDLSWIQRLKICVGAARGLAYLHTPAKTLLRIVHRDIKSSNILLDNNWNAKISDFGLSKFAPANNQFTYMISNPAGTLGYIDPLYLETGVLTKESDVYSFGVVLFEVLCGRLCYGNKDLPPLVGLVREYYEQNKISDVVYINMKDKINITSLKLFADVAYRCLSRERKERPSTIEIVSVLERALDIQEKADATVPGLLHVKLLREMGDGSINPLDAPNHYLILDVSPVIDHQPQMFKVKWNEVSTLYVANSDAQYLNIIVNKVESVNEHRNVGEATIILRYELTPKTKRSRCFDVSDVNGKNVGYFKVELLFKPIAHDEIPTISRSVQQAPIGTPKDGGLLVIVIHSALGQQAYHRSSVTLLFRDQQRKTTYMTNTSSPKWLQEFSFMLEQPPSDEYLHLEVTDDSWMGQLYGKGSFGHVDISLTDVINKKRTTESYQLKEGMKYKDGTYTYSLLKVELQWRTTD